MDVGLIFFDYVLKHKNLFLCTLMIITVLFGWQASQIGINASPYVVDKSHPVRQAHEELKRTFNSTGEQAMVVFTFPDTVFTVDRIVQLDRLSKTIQSMAILSDTDKNDVHHTVFRQSMNDSQPVVNSILKNELIQNSEKTKIEQLMHRYNPVAQVRSLTTIENIVDEGMLTVDKLVETLPHTKLDIKKIKKNALSNPMFNKVLLDEEGKSTAIWVEFNITSDDSQNMVRAYQALVSIVSESPLASYAHFSGVPVINAEIAQVMENDNQKFFPMVICVILLIIYLTFKRASVAIAALLIAVMSTVWTLGTMALFNVDQNIVSAILPIFIITIAVSDTIHFMTAYLYNSEHLNTQAVMSSLKRLLLPMCLTTITTSIGFISMAYTDLIFLSQFCIFVALGVVYALVITLFFLICCAPWVKRYEIHKTTGSYKTPFTAYYVWIKTHKFFAVAIGCVLVVSVIVGAAQVEVNNHSSHAFNPQTKIRQDADHITQQMGGIYPVNFWFKSDMPRGLISADFIEALELISYELSRFSEIGKVISPNDYIKRIHQVVAGEMYELPRHMNQDYVGQYLFLYENSSGRELRDVLDIHYQHARSVVLFNTDKADEFKKIITHITEYADTVLPDNIQLTVTGYGAEIVTATESVVYSQLISALSASILILFLMWCYFRSSWVAVFGIVPLLFTVLSNFALMAVLGVYLDIGTALIIGITFGIGIDYAIHFISDLKNRLSKGEQWDRAVEQSLHYVSRPIIKNSTALALGFLVLTLSSFAPLRQLGYFVSISMILCAVYTLLLLPLLFLIVKPQCFISSSKGSLSVSTVDNFSPLKI